MGLQLVPDLPQGPTPEPTEAAGNVDACARQSRYGNLPSLAPSLGRGLAYPSAVKLPPLSYLRAFDVAARHENFARAAAELNLSPAAVSQQMRALEARLGREMFQREGRGLILTRAGREYATAVRNALEQLHAATRNLGQIERAGQLTISTSQSFAMLWLLPRLADFRNLYPEIDGRLRVEDGPQEDPTLDDVDVAILTGRVRTRASTFGRCVATSQFQSPVRPCWQIAPFRARRRNSQIFPWCTTMV
jgi:DNA-binding transcriptional LysR family regulator